ncbi:mycothiol system anti-sigma-R factor [Quadrisphaera sp. DSM 44207]|uniref:mycothiol system anti-sigma-R factor n=1 Tax=Quadrisphaera sp. DSM 44207 TaxID=1881057 RepID=UPI00087F98EE|nr:mycothiol system anti-sigma-R factor [Quadrisphaera sp. DSM 44207]SDQ07846.1 mycothiol system anti-sigma-R factor [Quadrisphaera sp. DSM 44207]
MSGGRPHPSDCREVLDRVYEYVDGELGPHDLDLIRVHLAECAPCLRQYDLEALVKQLVRRSCQEDRAPEALRLRIVARISEVRLTAES